MFGCALTVGLFNFGRLNSFFFGALLYFKSIVINSNNSLEKQRRQQSKSNKTKNSGGWEGRGRGVARVSDFFSPKNLNTKKNFRGGGGGGGGGGSGLE